MTNRSRQGSAPVGGRIRGSSANHKPMKFLDLSFEGREQARINSITNGFRPHGGYRGTNKHPPALHSFNKSTDYQAKIQNDLDQLFADEKYSRCSSPGWALDASKEHNHTGESPLFVHKLLTPSKIDQQFDPATYHRALLQHKRPKTPNQVNGVSYYRPNRTHQYLTKTELKDSSSTDVDPKLGKPTRTTLLRARQRCNSAPINSYEARREIQRKLEIKDEVRRSRPPGLTIRDLLGASLPEGESLHSFLIGARYNRAHYLDSKSLFDYGVYMPRNNPLGCFVIRKNAPENEEYGNPGPTPDSPCSVFSDDEEGEHQEGYQAKCPMPPPQPPSTPNKLQRQAWDDASKVEVSIAPEETLPSTVAEAEEKKTSPPNMPIMEQIMNLEDGLLLNVKGKNASNTRPRSARSAGDQPIPYTGARPASARPNLPAVSIQGRSLNRVQKPVQKDNAINQTLLANNPQSTNNKNQLAPNPPERHPTPVPPQSPVPSHDPEEKPTGEASKLDITSQERIQPTPEVSVEQEGKKPALTTQNVVKVDKAINCPSVPSTAGDPAVKPEDTKNLKDMTNGDHENTEYDGTEKEETWPSAEEKVEIEKKVRFADEVNGEKTKPDGNVVFFMTEDDENKLDVTDDNVGKAEDQKLQIMDSTEGYNEIMEEKQLGEDNEDTGNKCVSGATEGSGDQEPAVVENQVVNSAEKLPQEVAKKDDGAGDASDAKVNISEKK